MSRNVIRESYKLLKERGLITLRTGEGAYVSKPESNTLANVIGRMLVMDSIDAEMVYEMWLLLETDAARLAAERAPEAEIDALETIRHGRQFRRTDRALWLRPLICATCVT